MANYNCITAVKLYNCAAAHDGTFVVDFPSRAAADSYYGSCNDGYCSSKYDIGSSYYQRDKGYIKVGINADVLNNAGINYCRWINPEVDNSRYFYGFIDDIIYQAPKTSFLVVRIDPWTTYFDRIRVTKCLVEREHVCVDDVTTIAKIGIAEPISVDPDIMYDKEYLKPTFSANTHGEIEDNFYGVICTGKKITYKDQTGWVQSQEAYVGGLPNTTYWYAFDLTPTAIEGLRDLIDKDESGELTLPSEDIIGVTMIPKDLADVTADDHFPDWLYSVGDDVPGSIRLQNFSFSGTTMQNGYTPKNKKLICYPYQVVNLRTYDGSLVELQPEKFNIGEPGGTDIDLDFYCNFALGNDSSMGVYPCHYDSNSSGPGQATANFAAGITVNTFPTIPLNIDAYKQYLAYSKEQRKSAVISMVLNGVGAAASIYTGSVVPLALAGAASNEAQKTAAVSNGLANIGRYFGTNIGQGRAITDSQAASKANEAYSMAKLNTAVQVGQAVNQISNQALQIHYDKAAAQRRPNIMTSPASGQLLMKCDAGGAWLEFKSISAEQAELIDNYFTHYGYQVSRADRYPQWRSRANVNYIKTSGCQVYGTIPTIYQNQLAAMINNGLTVFHGASNYGVFDLNNPIVNTSAGTTNTPY